MRRIRITLSLLLLAALLAAACPPARAGHNAFDASAIDAYMEAQIKASAIPGAGLALVRHGELLHSAGYGRADAEGTAVTERTPFIIGSLSKGFTALAVMQLVEAGQVELDAPLQQYLPWFTLADAEAAARITVRMLLQQTSGLGYNDGTRPLWDQPGELTLEERLRGLADLPLRRAPGDGWEYSNYNYMLLGMLVEAVAGQPYAAQMSTAVFQPLGMSGSRAAAYDCAGKAQPFRWWFGLPLPAQVPYPADAAPAGFIHANAADMGQYLAFQQAGDAALLSAAGLEQMHSDCVDTGGGDAYCYGWVRGEMNGNAVLTHEGAAVGYYAVIINDLESGWGVVLLTNANQMLAAPAKEIAVALHAHLAGGAPLQVSDAFSVQWGISDAVLLALTGLMVWSIVRLPRWGKKVRALPRQGFLGVLGRYVLPVLAEGIFPFIIWVFLPQGAGFPMWKVMGLFQPDLTAWVFVIAGLFLVRMGMRVVLLLPRRGT